MASGLHRPGDVDVYPGASTILFFSGVAVVMLLLGVAGAVYLIVRLSAPQHFRCPFLRRDVEVRFEEWGGRRQAVLRCSAFGRAEQIDCGTPCVESEDVARTGR